MDLHTTLQNAQSPDPNVRIPAETQLNHAVEQQYGEFLLALCSELATDGKPDGNRQLAGLYMKNLITAQDEKILQMKRERWLNCDPAVREQIRAGMLQGLLCPVRIVGHTAAQVVAAFGAVDAPMGQWQNLLPTLFSNVSSPESPMLTKVSSLEALGYMCEEMDPDSIQKDVVDVILNTIVDGMRADRENEIRKAAVTAMCNSLHFTTNNFKIENERNAIMQVLCEATQCSDIQVRMKAFEGLALVAELYYENLGQYMDTLFNLTASAIKADDQLVGQRAVEFWSTICDVESDLVEELKEPNHGEVKYLRITEQCAQHLTPILLETLTKQEDDSSDDSWNISMAGATCLEALALVVEDQIVDLVIPFISSNIMSGEWRLKEASIMAFGAIMNGPSEEKLTPIVASALPTLLQCVRDSSELVRDSATWTVGRVCEYHNRAISPDMIPTLFSTLSQTLEDEYSRVAVQGCTAVLNIAEACSSDADSETNVLSPYMPHMLEKLLLTTNREDWDCNNLRSSAFEAINMLVQNSAADMAPTVLSMLNEALSRLERTFLGQTDQQERMQLQSMLCSLISHCVQKLPKTEIMPLADRIMTLTLQVFTTKAAVAHEDAFLMVGYLADKLERDFGRYITHFMPALFNGLNNVEEHQVCTVSVGVIGDLCRALGAEMLPYCDDIVRILLELLQSQNLQRSVKPHVLSAFSDLSMALEGEFERYCPVVLRMLQQAGEVSITTDDDEMIDYINSLRESILDAYIGIVQGLQPSNKQDVVIPHCESILEFVKRSSTDPHKSPQVLKASIALLGDLGDFFGQKMVPVLSDPYVASILHEGSQDEDIKEIAEWTRQVMMKLQSMRK